jgi:hypothetical protein
MSERTQHMNIYTLLRNYKNNPYSFAAKYRSSVKYNGKFHIEVKTILESAGLCSTPSKFASTFNYLEHVDIYCNSCAEFKYTKIDAFLALKEYEKNPITFANKFYRKSKYSLYKDYFLKILRAFDPDFYEYVLITEDFLKTFFALYYKVSRNEEHNIFMERMQRVYEWA